MAAAAAAAAFMAPFVKTAARGCLPCTFSTCAASSASSSLTSGASFPRHLVLPTQLCRFRLSLLIAPVPYLQRVSAPFSARSMSGPPASLEELIKAKTSENPVVVYSKTWCPYCLRVKTLFKQLGVKPLIVELDELADEAEVQDALHSLTGQSTVPNVFIGGKHVGGCDDTMILHQCNMLVPMLKEAEVDVI